MRSATSSYAPTNVSVTDSAGGTLILAADENLNGVMLTNTHATRDVWFCDSSNVPLANKGFYLKAGTSQFWDKSQLPLKLGLQGIAIGGTAVVAIGRC